MPFCENDIRKEKDGVLSVEPIMVTITLMEYRSLVEEYTRRDVEMCNLRYENENLRNENYELRKRIEG